MKQQLNPKNIISFVIGVIIFILLIKVAFVIAGFIACFVIGLYIGFRIGRTFPPNKTSGRNNRQGPRTIIIED